MTERSMKNQIISIVIASLFLLQSCGGFKKVDTREIPISGPERAKKNVKEGRGVSLGGLGESIRGKTNYEFSTSNPLWRASLEILDFLPLTTVDYSGGLIVTDWYSDSNTASESLKITVRFLSNEVKSNSLKIIVHKKTCKNISECRIILLKSKIAEELQRSILANAAKLEIAQKNKKK